MSSGVQKETCVHVVNIPTEMSLAAMTKITNRTNLCFPIRACTERNNDGEQVPETIDPTCRCHSFIKKYYLSVPYPSSYLGDGATWLPVVVCPVPCFFVLFLYELLLSLPWVDSIVACANQGLPCVGQKATVRFNIVSPVKNVWTFVTLLQLITRNVQTQRRKLSWFWRQFLFALLRNMCI